MTFIIEHFLGTIVDFAVVLVLGLIGSFVKRGIPKRISDAVLCAINICVIYIGITGVLEAAPEVDGNCFLNKELFKVLVMIISMALGTLVGELIDLDKWINRLGGLLERKLGKLGGGGNFARGFVSCSLLLCVGAMSVNGAFADARGEPELLLAKLVLDGITTLVMSSALGIGCAFSAFLLLGYQGGMTLLAIGLMSVVPESTIAYMSATGSLIL